MGGEVPVMRARRLARKRGTFRLGIIALILSLVHAPLPEPDFHNIRHHDGRGEVCEYHDHLLRWHPGARSADDVATLHWHWFLPAVPDNGPPARDGSSAIHAHVPAWQASNWDDGPRISPDGSSRFVGRPVLSLVALIPPTDLANLFAALPNAGPPRPLGFGATFAPGASLTAMLHRWVC